MLFVFSWLSYDYDKVLVSGISGLAIIIF